MPTTLRIALLAGLLALLSNLAVIGFIYYRTHDEAVATVRSQVTEQSRVLAANQGLYNGFLAAGLIWSLLAPVTYATQLALFFLACVLIAGIYGGATANRRIWLLQALPAAIALIVLFVTMP